MSKCAKNCDLDQVSDMAGHTVPPTAGTGSLEDSSFDPKIPLLEEFPELIIRKECKEMCRKLITTILFIIVRNR